MPRSGSLTPGCGPPIFLDFRRVDAAIAVLGSLPGVIGGGLILPQLAASKRWLYSLLSLGIAYLVFLVVMIALTRDYCLQR